MPDYIQNAPEISFIENKSVEDVRAELVADFESYMTEAEGRPVRLARSSVHRMILYAAAAQIYQAMQYVDRAGKQNLLKYSYDQFLDNLALLKGVVRLPAANAYTTLRFTLSAPRESAVGIPAGTRASDGGAMFFATEAYLEIPAGSLTGKVRAVCTVPGLAGNGFQPGELKALVDPVPYVAAVENLTLTEGGADLESDGDLAERVFLAPSAYSTAGPEDSYRYHARAYSPAVGDVAVTSDQAAGRVDVVFLLADGSSPGPDMVAGLQEYLQADSIRPMTDLVVVAAPEKVPYRLDLTYYVNRSDSGRALAVQAAVRTAVDSYVRWQRVIGRDVNPSKLLSLVVEAGAKRAEIAAPAFAPVASTAVAELEGAPQVRYGGLEDD